MALNLRTFLTGLRIFPKAATTIDSKGELEVLNSDGRLYYNDGSTTSAISTANSTDTLTNKSISGSTNTITNVSLTTGVTGTLPVGNGGTGLATLTAHDVLVGNGTGNVTLISPSTSGFVLTSNGTGADPTFQTNPGTGAITSLTGDVTATGPGAAAATLATVNGNVGSFGSSTSIPNFTVNAKGLITAAGGNAVIAPAGTLSGTTLNSTVVTSSLTSVGTISSGTWNGTAIDAAHGGTGLTTLTAHDVLVGNGTGNITLVSPSTSGFVLTSNGTSADPSFQASSNALSVTTQTNTNYTALTTDNLILVSTGNTNRTITLFAASGNTGKKLIIKKTDTGTGNVIIDANASETIDGGLTVTLGSQYDALTIICDGSNWFIEEDKRLIYATYSRNTSQAISDSTTTVVNFDVKEDDPMSLVTTGASWVFTVPVGGGGTYEINSTAYFSQSVFNDGESVQLFADKNGTTIRGAISYAHAATGTPRPLGCTMGSVLFNAVAGDTIDVSVRQNSGGSANLTADSVRCWVSIKRASR